MWIKSTHLVKQVSVNRTILMVEHNLKVVSTLADRITVLQRGSILAEGAYAEVSRNPRCWKRIWGTPMTESLHAEKLRISGLHAFYGESHILHGIDLEVGEGEVVTLSGPERSRPDDDPQVHRRIGRAGRTGSIKINGVEAITIPTHRIAHLGIGYCPEERGIFSSLTVEENLLLPPVVKRRRHAIAGNL